MQIIKMEEFPDGDRGLKPLAIVMKLVAVRRRNVTVATVKLSDNPSKATGPQDMVARITRKTGYDTTIHKAVECAV